MSQQASQDAPASAQLLSLLFGFMTTQAIATAAKFGIADLLKDSPRTADELAQTTGVHPRALYRLLRMLASVGIFSEDADGRFRLTPLAEALRSDAPDSMRGFAIYMGADWHWRVWEGLPYSVQ